jgi:hypothetical protein
MPEPTDQPLPLVSITTRTTPVIRTLMMDTARGEGWRTETVHPQTPSTQAFLTTFVFREIHTCVARADIATS